MQIIYWAHSYRDEDAPVNRHFGTLIEQAERMVVSFDPPSQSVSEAKLQRNRRSCDGMVATLTWRATGPSPYILFEVGLALQARMPVLVFIDDRLNNDVLPTRVQQQRFSHRTYFRQVREQIHALRVLKSYMGDPPPTRYQAHLGQRSCGIIGFAKLAPERKRLAYEIIGGRGYRITELDRVDTKNPLTFQESETIASTDVVLRYSDNKSARSLYWAGAISAAAVPSIAFTTDPAFEPRQEYPKDFQSKPVELHGTQSLEQFIYEQFDLFEQNFLNIDDVGSIERYVKMQIQAGALDGNYEPSTRNLFVGAIMGDQYNVSGQTAAVGPNANVENVTFNQVWNQLSQSMHLPSLAAELGRLREVMNSEAKEPEQLASVGSVAAAEASARQGNGPKTMEFLKAAGGWALRVAEKIGVDLAKDALKGALGI